MTARFWWALSVAALLIFSVIFSQVLLEKSATDLANSADAICELLGAEKTDEGTDKLELLIRKFHSKKWVFLVFVNDLRIYELNRSLSRAQELAKEGEWSPALEALSDFASVLREVSETHRPTVTNIF